MQPSQNDRDELADRGLGRQAAGCCEGVEAVARELVSMQERREFGVVVPVGLVGIERVGLQHSFEPLASVASLYLIIDMLSGKLLSS